MTISIVTNNRIIAALNNPEIAVSEREFVGTERRIPLIDVYLMDVLKIENVAFSTYLEVGNYI